MKWLSYTNCAAGPVTLRFHSESGPMTDFKIGTHSFPLDAQHERNSVEYKRQVYFLCHMERHLTEFPHFRG